MSALSYMPSDETADVDDATGMPAEGDAAAEGVEETERLAAERLLEFLAIAERGENIADHLDDAKLAEIGQKVGREFDIDKESRADWEQKVESAMKLAMQVAEDKSYPWPGAANVKWPLLISASLQFHARAYPAIVQSGDVVKAKVQGADPEGQKRNRADRIAAHMSYQLLEEIEEWEENTDRLLVMLPIVGMLFRKTYFDPAKGRPCDELLTHEHVVVNYNAKSTARAPRITQVLEFYPYEVVERQRMGLWREADLGLPMDYSGDDDAPHCFLEQHCMLDLDEDGYPEPWIVTVHKDTTEVLRIVPRFDADGVKLNEDREVAKIEADHYFTKFGFIPAPDGSYYDIGFGWLLHPLSETINTTINQMLDAATMQNAGGGFIGGGVDAGRKGAGAAGTITVSPGKWKRVNTSGQDLRANVVPHQHPGPSPVLFSLLGMLLEAAQDITSVKDILTGEGVKSNEPATTTLARIEQGLKVFSAIYKRIYRSLKHQYGLLYDLNARYLNPERYFIFHDRENAIAQQDYAQGDLDVTPMADAAMVTDMQKLGKAQFLMGFMDDPMFDGMEIRRRVLEAAGIDEMDTLFAKESPPNPALLAKADEIDIRKREIAIKEQELRIEAAKAAAEIVERRAKAMSHVADAESKEAGIQIDAYKAQVDAILREAERKTDVPAEPAVDAAQLEGRGMGGVAGPASDTALPGVAPGPLPGDPGPMGGGF